MDKNDILDYVTETPGNTNRAVLGSMLDSFSGGGGGGGLICHLVEVQDQQARRLDKTYGEILDAMRAGQTAVLVQEEDASGIGEGAYQITDICGEGHEWYRINVSGLSWGFVYGSSLDSYPIEDVG